MLAELAAANAAFAVIKTTIANGHELVSAGKAMADFFSARDTLRDRGNKKKNSLWNKINPSKASDFEEFLALEQIKQKEEELKQFMIWSGRPGLWHDWVQFQVQARKRRQREEAERKLAKREFWEMVGYIVLIVLGLGILAFVAFLVMTGLKQKGAL